VTAAAGTAAPQGGFLDAMVAAARARVAAAREGTPLERPSRPGPPGRLREALRRAGDTRETRGGAQGPPELALIAEVKRRSPSKGDIAPGLDAVARARAYESAGADAISVLTEPDRFGGSLDDLRAVAAAVALPVLRKDFIVDACQVREAAGAGAAAVLLIVAALSDDDLALLLEECAACGLDALVEVHDLADLSRARTAGAVLVGVNNRDLTTLKVDLATTERLVPAIGPTAFPVSESGIAGPADASRVAAAGARGLLVGEALVRTPAAQLQTVVAALKRRGAPR
jgi:indole-3-glycerol phosphate synthase